MSQSDRHELADLVVSLRRHLQRQQRMGIGLLPQAEVAEKVVSTSASEKPTAKAERLLGSANAANVTSLEELRAHIGDCRRCKLHSGRTHVVFGVAIQMPS